MKKVLTFFSFLFFVSYLSSVATAAEHQQKGRGAKSAPRGGAHGGVQGNIQKGRGGIEQRGGGQVNRPNHAGGRRVEHYPGRGRVEHYSFRHHRHYNSFTVHERRIWHGGNWRNGCYRSQCGAWWVVGGYYYYYPERVYGYPYPSVISAIVFDEASIMASTVVPVAPVVVRQPVVVAPQAPVLYYCPDPPGYSPEVQNCNVGWQTRTMPPPPPK